MSLDRRLREELQRDAQRVVPDVERNLGAVEARNHRRPLVGLPALVAASVVIVVAIALRFGTSTPTAGGPYPSASSLVAISPSPDGSASATYAAIAGTYVVMLDPANSAVAKDGVGGTWTMRLEADGEIFLSPPATFGAGTSPMTGVAFTLAADRFRSNIFYNDYCSSIGTYTWSLQAGRLSFAPVDDTCAIRQTLLSTLPWQTSP